MNKIDTKQLDKQMQAIIEEYIEAFENNNLSMEEAKDHMKGLVADNFGKCSRCENVEAQELLSWHGYCEICHDDMVG